MKQSSLHRRAMASRAQSFAMSQRPVVRRALAMQGDSGTMVAMEFLMCRGFSQEVVRRVLMDGVTPGQ